MILDKACSYPVIPKTRPNVVRNKIVNTPQKTYSADFGRIVMID